MELLEDLGLREYGKQGKKQPYGIFLCPECQLEVETSINSVKYNGSATCNKCSCRNNQIKRNEIALVEAKSTLQKKVKEIHGDNLIVNIDTYTKGTEVLEVTCQKHNLVFFKTPGNLTHKTHPQGCPECTKERPSTRTSDGWSARWNAEYPVRLYYIKIGDYWKIGCTTKSVAERFRMEKLLDIQVVYEEVLDIGGNAYKLEHELLKSMQKYRYKGAHILYQGKGDSELLTKPIENIEQLVANLKQKLKEK